MARWQAGAPDRLRAAALEQFAARGFDATTVADIAAAAGVTERTFFRHYADKREVLFQGQEEFELAFVDGLTESDDPMTAVRGALSHAASLFADERRPSSRMRQQVIDGHEALRERELLKLAGIARRLTHELVGRGADPIAATLAAETGMSVFRTAFAAWIAEGEARSFADVQDDALNRLHTLLAG